MIEIIFLVFLILFLIRPLAKARRESLWKWILLSIGVWVGTEVIFILGFYLLLRRGVFPPLTTGTIIAIVVLLYVTTLATTLSVIYALWKKPLVTDSVTPVEPLA